MKKKIIVIIVIVLAIIVVFYFPIPIGKEIIIVGSNGKPQKNENIIIPDGIVQPDQYTVTKSGFVYKNGKMIKYLNLINRIQIIKSNDKYTSAKKILNKEIKF